MLRWGRCSAGAVVPAGVGAAAGVGGAGGGSELAATGLVGRPVGLGGQHWIQTLCQPNGVSWLAFPEKRKAATPCALGAL